MCLFELFEEMVVEIVVIVEIVGFDECGCDGYEVVGGVVVLIGVVEVIDVG